MKWVSQINTGDQHKVTKLNLHNGGLIGRPKACGWFLLDQSGISAPRKCVFWKSTHRNVVAAPTCNKDHSSWLKIGGEIVFVENSDFQ